MRLDNVTPQQIGGVCKLLGERARKQDEALITYIDLGTRIVRLECHSKAFMRHVQRQLECSLKEHADHYDATLVIWQDLNIAENALAALSILDEPRYRQNRISRLQSGQDLPAEQMLMYNEDIIRFWPILDINPGDGSLLAWNPQNNTYYYGITNLDPEEFIKRGHIFVHILFRICNIQNSSLSHGAVIGLENTGVLFCAFGYRGKSTLCVRALIDGFEYVSDDYFILGKQPDGTVLSWPIYSIVALAPPAYDQLYNDFNGKFLSMNARKDKYMFNIANYHRQFKYAYPVRLAMYPNICPCSEPSIEKGWRELCLEELSFSILNNTCYLRDATTVGKMAQFMETLPTYRINLCPDAKKNVRCLRNFLEEFNSNN